jgi:small nuclear ribonucleoprotein G
MEKRLFVQLNGNRKVIGILRGYDVFLNIVLDEAVEEKAGGERQRLGMVVGAQMSRTLTQEAKI